MRAVALYAQRQGVSISDAASELIRRGSSYQLGTRTVNGLPVFEVPTRFPRITTGQVRQLLDER